MKYNQTVNDKLVNFKLILKNIFYLVNSTDFFIFVD